MKNDSEDNLEKLIHRALAKLPELQAPETLIPRVLETIRIEARRPWWRRSWFYWPFGARVVSVVFALSIMTLIFTGTAFLWQDAAGAVELEVAEPWFARISAIGDILGTMAGAALVVWNSISKLWLLLCMIVAFMMYVACVGIGTLCFRLAVNER